MPPLVLPGRSARSCSEPRCARASAPRPASCTESRGLPNLGPAPRVVHGAAVLPNLGPAPRSCTESRSWDGCGWCGWCGVISVTWVASVTGAAVGARGGEVGGVVRRGPAPRVVHGAAVLPNLGPGARVVHGEPLLGRVWLVWLVWCHIRHLGRFRHRCGGGCPRVAGSGAWCGGAPRPASCTEPRCSRASALRPGCARRAALGTGVAGVAGVVSHPSLGSLPSQVRWWVPAGGGVGGVVRRWPGVAEITRNTMVVAIGNDLR